MVNVWQEPWEQTVTGVDEHPAGLFDLHNVGEHRSQVMELGVLIVASLVEDVHQLGKTRAAAV